MEQRKLAAMALVVIATLVILIITVLKGNKASGTNLAPAEAAAARQRVKQAERSGPPGGMLPTGRQLGR